jgi:hypothetical protein
MPFRDLLNQWRLAEEKYPLRHCGATVAQLIKRKEVKGICLAMDGRPKK